MTRRTAPRPLSRSAAGAAIALFATDPETVVRFAPKTTLDGRPDGPTRAPKKQPERDDVLTPVLTWLADLARHVPGLAYRRIYTTGRRLADGTYIPNPMKGLEDIQVLVPPHGRLWAVETKAPRHGRQSDDQVRRQREVEAAGGVYSLPRSLAEAQAAWAQHFGRRS